ncbi:Hypothetical protein CINCED_3A000564 [Cinara cedri]|uniref:Haem peroxidase,Haem peroxidase, animal type n=1 Tax=Cinara cedri TaxID=506608 RepID=A0A5E4M544_9HEMI|nr:Hypothetical protein CINCED_3A000564 [Cinara cedri]
MKSFFTRLNPFDSGETDPLLRAKAELQPFWKKSWFSFLITVLIIGISALVIVYLAFPSKSSSDTVDTVVDAITVLSTKTISVVSYIETKPGLSGSRVSSVATTNGDYFKKCAPAVTCDPNAKYRTYNGSCNNLQNPNWGAAMTPFYRLMDAEFDDGNETLRKQLDGKPLPSARVVGLKLFYLRDIQYLDYEHSEILVPWGQFLTHDVSFYPDDIRGSDTPAHLDHCFDKDKSTLPFECETIITIPSDDPVYSPYNVSLFKFVRSTTSANFSCPLIPRTILNRNTQYIDASHVYGSNLKTADSLRAFENGKLRTWIYENEEYCPKNPDSEFKDGPLGKSNVQFTAGDINVNQNLAIALFQNLFLRFHNVLANELQTINPSWSDERVYQETRRIIGAVMQVITYDHFLPVLLGDEYMKEYKLTGPTVYDPSISSALAQEMTSGAFRAVHNIIPAKFNLIAANYSTVDQVEPSRILLKPDLLVGNFDNMLRGFLETPGRLAQPSYNTLITNVVFKIPNLDGYSGFDLLSYDIQRGRDNGLPPYNKIRQICGLTKAIKFSDLSDLISLEDIETLKTLYSTVHDIDFIVGAILEKPRSGSMVGPTTACVIGDTFYRFKAGDRFFYDIQGQPGSFTLEQIQSLKNISLSNVMCSSSHLDHMQKESFRYVDHKWMSSQKYSCDSYKIDLSQWKE